MDTISERRRGMLNLQVAYDIEVAAQEIQPQMKKEVLPRTAAYIKNQGLQAMVCMLSACP